MSRTLGAAACAVLRAASPADKVTLTYRAVAEWRAGTLLPGDGEEPPARPARPARPELKPPRDMPRRRNAGSLAGRIALLHALAHIELNAIDLAWDLVARFPDPALPRAFADDWLGVAAEEAKHFALLADRLATLGAAYGDLPAHDGLWEAAQATSGDLLARLAVVPLVLEARGLDVTPEMIARLGRAGDAESARVLQVIHDDEIAHVAAGARWFRWECARREREPVEAFRTLVRDHFNGALKPPFNGAARAAAGLDPTFYEALAATPSPPPSPQREREGADAKQREGEGSFRSRPMLHSTRCPEDAMAAEKLLVIRNGTLIDGSGAPAQRNDALVIAGNRIRSIGALPPDVRLEDESVRVIDAAGQWIMPGLIDAHVHLSYGYPNLKGEGRGRGNTRPELNTLKAARGAQAALRAGVTGIAVPGGTYFIDVGVRDAVRLGVIEGPRIHCAGRMIIAYGCIEDDDPSWVGAPDHSIGVLCNTAAEMVTEVRRQDKHGVNFIKMADSRSGATQMLAKEEIAAVVAEAHRRGLRVAIHSRGAGSTRAAAEAGVDWIVHADLATEADLEAVAKAGIPILPTATFLARVIAEGERIGAEQVQLDVNRMKRHFDNLVTLMQRSREMGIRLLCGSDSGNNTFMPFGELHANEAEILVRYGGFSPLEAIQACTKNNAFALRLEGEVGELKPGRLADVIVLKRDPVADITVLQGGRHLAWVIKDGRVIDRGDADAPVRFRHAVA